MSKSEKFNTDAIDKSKFNVPISDLKPRPIVGISGDACLLDLVDLLIKEKQGSVCVVEDKKLVGIVSERDLFMNVDENFDEYLQKPVSEIMTKKLLTKK